MKKLVLDLDSLDVQSFSTQPEPKPRPGTVYAHATQPLYTCFYCGMSWPYTGCTDCSCFEVCQTPACE